MIINLSGRVVKRHSATGFLPLWVRQLGTKKKIHTLLTLPLRERMASITAPVLPMTIDKVSSLLSKVFGEITSDKVDFFWTWLIIIIMNPSLC